MSYVCTALQENVCTQWAVYQPLLPELTIAQGLSIGGAIFLVLAFTHGMKILINFVRSS